MNIDKFVKNLNKINNFDSWENPKGNLTKIEKDILLEYIRKMYKAVYDDSVVVKERENKTLLHREETPIIEKVQEVKAIEIEEKNEIQTPTIEHLEIAEVKKEIKKEEIPVKMEDVVFEPKSTEVKTDKLKNTSHISYSVEFMSIFKDFTSKELSEKLSMLPIKDLKKAFGLNEKIFTINELFNGDSVSFDRVMDDLNQLGSTNEAKEYIIDKIAEKFNWDNEHKIKKAEQFFRTIRRRYIS